MAGNILGGCLFESVLTICCSSLLEDVRAILSVKNFHLAVLMPCALHACASLKIVSFVFLHFLSV